MDGDFHVASVMGHDILGLSSGLDSVSSLLGLESCSESIYSSGLGLDDVHHDGSVIDYSLIDSGRSGLEEDLDTGHISLEGLIPLVGPNQCPTPPNIFGNARVKVRTGDFINFDRKDVSSIEDLGTLSSLLNDALVSTSLSTTQLASLNTIRTPPRDYQEKATTNFSLETLGNIPGFVHDEIVSTSLSTTQLASLSAVRTPSRDYQEKAATNLDFDGAISIETLDNIPSFVHDAIVSASLSTTQLASLNTERTPSRDYQEKAARNLDSECANSVETLGNIPVPSLVNDAVVSTSLSTTTSASSKKVRKKVKTPSSVSQEKRFSSKKSKIPDCSKDLVRKPLSKAKKKKKKSSSKKGTSRARELKGRKSLEQKEPKHFKCSTCGAVYKSHELCVKHVLDRHKPGMSIKHRLPDNLHKKSQKPQNSHLHQDAKTACVKPYANSKHTQDSSRLKRKKRKTKKDFDSQNDRTSKKKLRKCKKNQETNTDGKSSPKQRKRKLTKLKRKCANGSKRKRKRKKTKRQKLCNRSPRMNVSSLEEKPSAVLVHSLESIPEDVGGQEIEDEPSDVPPVSELKQPPKTSPSKRKLCNRSPKVNVSSRKEKPSAVLVDSLESIPEDVGGQEIEDEPSDVPPVSKLKQPPKTAPSKRKLYIRSPKVNVSSREEKPSAVLVDSLESIPEDVGGQEIEDEPSDVPPMSELKQPPNTSPSKRKCVAHTAKRGRPKGSKNKTKSSKNGSEHHKEVTRKRTVEEVGERMVYLLEPRQLTIVICPRCQKAFTTYSGYSRHVTQVHNATVSDVPGKLMQLLVQRSPQFCSKNTPKQGLDEPLKKRLCGKDGICQKTGERSMCKSSDAFSSTATEYRSDQSQPAFKTTETETSDCPTTMANNSEKKMHARSTQTDIVGFQEPLGYRQNENSVALMQRVLIHDVRTDYGASNRTSLNSENKFKERDDAAMGYAVAPEACLSSDDLLPIDIKIKQSNTKRSDTTEDQTKEISAMTEQRGSLLCARCGMVFEDFSSLDDQHQLGSAPGELMCHWTAKEKADEGHSFLCPVCGIHINSQTDVGSHSGCHGVVFEDSLDMDGNHQSGSAPVELVCQRTAEENAVEGSSFLCSEFRINFLSPADDKSHSCKMDLSTGVHPESYSSPGSSVSVGDKQWLESSLWGTESKDDLEKDHAGLDITGSFDETLQQCQGLFGDFTGVIRGQIENRSEAVKRINARTERRHSTKKQSGSTSHTEVKMTQQNDLVCLDSVEHMLEQSQGLFNRGSHVIEGINPEDRNRILKRTNTGTAKGFITEKQSGSAFYAKVKLGQVQDNPVCCNSLDHMLGHGSGFLRKSTGAREAEKPEHSNMVTNKRHRVDSSESAIHAKMVQEQDNLVHCDSLDHILRQGQGYMSKSTGAIEAGKHEHSNMVTKKRHRVDSSESAIHATVRTSQAKDSCDHVSLDSMLEQCQRMLEESTDVLEDGSF